MIGRSREGNKMVKDGRAGIRSKGRIQVDKEGERRYRWAKTSWVED